MKSKVYQSFSDFLNFLAKGLKLGPVAGSGQLRTKQN